MEFNPYAAPQAEVIPVVPQAETLRREHINTEATIKTAGILYIIAAVVFLVLGLNVFVQNPDVGSAGLIAAAVYVVLAVGLFWLGGSLRRLKKGARIPGILLSILGLVGVPLGTILSLLILISLAGKKGKFVMSPEYQQIIAATPHVKRKTSIVVWVLLILLLLILIGIIASVAMR